MFTTFKKSLIEKMGLFARQESGMTLPLLAFSLVALTGFTGLAIDVGRVQMVQSKLQFSVDAAGLAAGATVSTASTSAEFAKYLDVNFNGYMGATLTGHSVTANSDNTVFTLSATATLPTTFMGVVGVHSVVLTANSQITRKITGLELVLVLDNTGSMAESAGGSTTKLASLKTAATALVTNLFGGKTEASNGKLWVGIVPFAEGVNIGTSHPLWIGTKDATANANWAGCVDARPTYNNVDYGITDDTPTSAHWYTMFNLRSYIKCTKVGTDPETCSSTIKSKCTPSYDSYSKTTVSCKPNGPYAYASPLEYNSDTDYWGNRSGPEYNQFTGCAQEVTPLTKYSSTLTTAINNMSANGGTIISEGMVWAWRMLSPSWRGYWEGTMGGTLPLDYNTKGMTKAVVLLTDGLNTMYDSEQEAYWYPINNWTGKTTVSDTQAKLDDKTLAICVAMKAKGINVYTIGLGPRASINETLLKGCASQDNYYFYSPTTAELQTVFNSIGDSLSNLRVSQ